MKTFYLTRYQRMTEVTTVRVDAETEEAAHALAAMGRYLLIGDAEYADFEDPTFETESDVEPAEEVSE